MSNTNNKAEPSFTPSEDNIFPQAQSIIIDPTIKELYAKIMMHESSLIAMNKDLEHTGSKEELQAMRADLNERLQAMADSTNSSLRSLNIAMWSTAIAGLLTFIAVFISVLVEIPWGDIIWIIMKNSSQ